MDEHQPVECALDLMRRMPPQKLEVQLEDLCDIMPDYAEAFYENIEKPLTVAKCSTTGKEYLQSEYNRDADSFRSPWSNKFEPEIQSDLYPSASLRSLEVAFNEAFEVYTKLYYEGGVSSVYLWEQKKGFSGTILIKKVNDKNKGVRGAWDSLHLFEADINGSHVVYKLASTVLLYTITSNSNVGVLNLSGNVRRMTEHESSSHTPGDHIINLGQLIEEVENKLRNTLQEVYFQKTKDIVNGIRNITSRHDLDNQKTLRDSLANKLKSQPNKDTQEDIIG